jgi:hypothetical protein
MLLGRDAQATQPVRSHDSRGRHTTTHRQLFQRAGGGCIIDTPGMRSVESWIRLDVNAGDEASPRKPDRASRKPETKQKRRDRRRSEDAET